jgi:predicted RNase H-like nuclease (RuvC/YqgF family)
MLAILGVSVAVAVFKVQSIHYHTEMDKLRSELAEAQIQNTILQTNLRECKKVEEDFKAKNDKMLAELLQDFNKFKKSN